MPDFVFSEHRNLPTDGSLGMTMLRVSLILGVLLCPLGPAVAGDADASKVRLRVEVTANGGQPLHGGRVEVWSVASMERGIFSLADRLVSSGLPESGSWSSAAIAVGRFGTLLVECSLPSMATMWRAVYLPAIQGPVSGREVVIKMDARPGRSLGCQVTGGSRARHLVVAASELDVPPGMVLVPDLRRNPISDPVSEILIARSSIVGRTDATGYCILDGLPLGVELKVFDMGYPLSYRAEVPRNAIESALVVGGDCTLTVRLVRARANQEYIVSCGAAQSRIRTIAGGDIEVLLSDLPAGRGRVHVRRAESQAVERDVVLESGVTTLIAFEGLP